MDSDDLGNALNRALPLAPLVPAMLVPEADLVRLVICARNAVFIDAKPEDLRVLALLDRASEPFSDMLDPNDIRLVRFEVRNAAERVGRWLDAGCITPPPGIAIRQLVEAFR